MRFTVVWRTLAQQQLAQCWITSPDRNAVTAAAASIDAALQRDPLNIGESRSGAERIAFFDPLWVQFEVSEPDRLVTVIDIWSAS
jgi:hypothetical protein